MTSNKKSPDGGYPPRPDFPLKYYISGAFARGNGYLPDKSLQLQTHSRLLSIRAAKPIASIRKLIAHTSFKVLAVLFAAVSKDVFPIGSNKTHKYRPL